MKIHVRGSIGILLFAYDKNILSVDDVKKALDKMKKANRRISDELYQYALDYVEK